MLKHSLAVSGMGEISSGENEPAIYKVRLFRCVNPQSRLAPGSAEPARLEVSLFADPGTFHIAPGQKMELYTLLPDGQRRKEGTFYLDSAVWTGAHRCTLFARDALKFLERDVAPFINSLTAWPYRLGALARLVCQHCGVSLDTTEFPWSDLFVEKAIYYYVTGAQVMSWIGAIAGRFCRATDDGKAELAWYVPTEETVALTSQPGRARVEFLGGAVFIQARDMKLQSGILTAPGATVSYANKILTLTLPVRPGVYGCLQGGLQRRHSPVLPPDGVRIGYSYAAMCRPYPGDGDVLTLTGNRLLKEIPVDQMTRLAATVYDDLKNLSFTPCRLRVSAEADIRPGQILTFSDGAGQYRTLVTETQRTGAVTEIRGGTL